MIQIYGTPRGSAGRCYMMLEEVGQPYEIMPLDMMEKKEHKSPEYLKLNPNGKVPCLIDGDFVIWESTAINFYLAEKYKPELLGRTPEEKGLIQQWSTWCMVELQPPLVDMIIQLMFVPEPKRDMALVERSKEKVPPMLAVLDQAMMGKTYLVNERLTVADFNVASVVNIAAAMKFDLSPYKNIERWFSGMKERPSFKKFIDLRKH
ncbi:MAG: glutathione S-transferase family protein [Bdellovibrionales bacterium]|nr:glutathione S-transferase family protein [Bdellovibrionales bacterium]